MTAHLLRSTELRRNLGFCYGDLNRFIDSVEFTGGMLFVLQHTQCFCLEGQRSCFLPYLEVHSLLIWEAQGQVCGISNHLLLLSGTSSCTAVLSLALAAVLSRIAVALPDADDVDVARSSSTAWHSGSSYLPSAGAAPGDAVMSPAALLADSIGCAVNSRVKYLRFKHHQREFDKKEQNIRREARESHQQLQQAQLGEKLSEGISRYNQHSHKEAGEYQAGQTRLDVFQQIRNMRAQEKKAAKAAKVRLCMHTRPT